MDAVGASMGHFDHVDWRLAVVAVACQLLGSVCHARAWANLLQAARPDRHVSRAARCCALTSPGVAANAVIPAHAGDAAKIALVRRAVPGTAIATIVTTLLMLTGIDIVLGGGALLATASTSLGPSVPRPSGIGLLIPVALVLAAGAAARRRAPQARGRARARPAGRCVAAQSRPLPARGRELAGRRLARARRRGVRRAARLRAAGIAAGCRARRRRHRARGRDPLPAGRGRARSRRCWSTPYARPRRPRASSPSASACRSA